MASIDVGIHPDPAGIRARHFGTDSVTNRFSVLICEAGGSCVSTYVHNRRVLDALQAALDEIRLDMGRAEQAAMAAKRTARADEIRADMDASEQARLKHDDWHYENGTPIREPGEYVTGASDQVPTEMADWPAMAAMAPGELMEIHGK